MLNPTKQLETLLNQAWQEVQKTAFAETANTTNIQPARVSPVKEQQKALGHGDFSSNFALITGKQLSTNARSLAEQIVTALQFILKTTAIDWVTKVEVAGPGFINLFVDFCVDQQNHQQSLLASIIQDQSFFTIKPERKKSILLEFVSANPTGPLHVGHGRGAAYGATLVNLLRAAGHEVRSEYYVNDAGRQMDILAFSVWLRYLAIDDQGLAARFAEGFIVNTYRGDYIIAIAKSLTERYGTTLIKVSERLLQLIEQKVDKAQQETYVDQCIKEAKSLLGNQFREIADFALQNILADIREDLADFGVTFDRWFPEQNLYLKDSQGSNAIDPIIASLSQSDFTYEKDGALWFKAAQFGDNEDRVLRRENGLYTYFAADTAYHQDKMSRGHDQVINIWGADHHGYIPRIKAALQALGYDSTKLTVLLVQFANLYSNDERIPMSTRAGQFVSLRDLRNEVGNDAVRLFYLLRKADQHMDFNIDLAKSQTKDNPVYYLQYAHARIKSIFARLEQKQESHHGSFHYDQKEGLAMADKLDHSHEKHLMMSLATYEDIITKAAARLDPLMLVNYLRQLAADFHAYYNAVRILPDDNRLDKITDKSKDQSKPEDQLFQARLALCEAIAQVLRHGLGVLGISAPEKMQDQQPV